MQTASHPYRFYATRCHTSIFQFSFSSGFQTCGASSHLLSHLLTIFLSSKAGQVNWLLRECFLTFPRYDTLDLLLILLVFNLCNKKFLKIWLIIGLWMMIDIQCFATLSCPAALYPVTSSLDYYSTMWVPRFHSWSCLSSTNTIISSTWENSVECIFCSKAENWTPLGYAAQNLLSPCGTVFEWFELTWTPVFWTISDECVILLLNQADAKADWQYVLM